MKTLVVKSSLKEELIDITDRVTAVVRELPRKEGLCVVFCPHTTAGLTVNECADSCVAVDIATMLGKLVPQQGTWLHEEGNSPAHVKASLMGSSVMIPVVDGTLMLGRWQGIFLCEFDGTRTREVWVQVYS